MESDLHIYSVETDAFGAVFVLCMLRALKNLIATCLPKLLIDNGQVSEEKPDEVGSSPVESPKLRQVAIKFLIALNVHKTKTAKKRISFHTENMEVRFHLMIYRLAKGPQNTPRFTQNVTKEQIPSLFYRLVYGPSKTPQKFEPAGNCSKPVQIN